MWFREQLKACWSRALLTACCLCQLIFVVKRTSTRIHQVALRDRNKYAGCYLVRPPHFQFCHLFFVCFVFTYN